METSEHTGLKRRLTSGQVSMIGLSGALGTGLFLGSGSVISLGGPATIISYTLAGLVALAVVWALAEMVSTHPVPGGPGAVAASYLGPFAGYITHWNLAIELMIAVGAEVAASATYLQFWFPNLPLGLGTILCSLLVIGLNLATVRLYGTSEYWFSMIKVTAIVVFILLGLYLIFVGTDASPATGLTNLTTDGGFFATGIGGVLAAGCMAVFSFGGTENVSIGAAESEHPERDVPRAAHAMIWRLLIFYVLAIFVVLALQPWTTTAQSHGTVTESPFVRVLDLTGVPAAAHIMNAILLVAALSAANGCLYAASRMLHSLGRQHMAPAFVARTSDHGAPRGAVLLASAGMAVASILALTTQRAFMLLYGCATIGILVTWVMVMLTHRKFRIDRARAGLGLPKHHLYASPVVNYLVIAASIAIFVALWWLLPVVWAGVPYLIILCLSYLLVRKHHHPAPEGDLLSQSVASEKPAAD